MDKLTQTNVLNVINKLIKYYIKSINRTIRSQNSNELTLEYDKVKFCLRHYLTSTPLAFHFPITLVNTKFLSGMKVAALY